MAAAMLVAVLVGAIRTEADHTFNPAAVLHALNARLLGRAGGHFATCIAARLFPDGTMLLANAGHLPAYANGKVMETEGDLPLGLNPTPAYEVYRAQFGPADRVVFLTDGVPEARDQAGTLLGFERAQQLSSLSARQIATAAIAHGHDDDITVLSVVFNG